MKVMNPVLPGFNPDPSLLRVGEDYYIATSTFEWFPGVCIHHSKDLVNWEIVSYGLTDDKKMDLAGIDTSCGIWAPNLTYSDGMFYLLYTIVYTDRHRYKDTHNFMVTATDVSGPWSDPIALSRTGFDPSMFHDVDGKKWLVNMMFDYRLDHNRFGGVLIQEYNTETKKLTGPVYNIFKGSERGTTEGPNLFYYNGYYYLVAAEGGTSFNHCVTMCRSRKVTGPYEICPNNPVLTSAGKEGVRLERAGHGQIIQAADGSWYMAHLCSRTVDHCSIMGRETSIQNMELSEDGWFRLKEEGSCTPSDTFEVPYEVEKAPKKSGVVDFSGGGIPLDYMTLRKSKETCGIRVWDGTLELTGGNALSSKFNQSLLARRQQAFSYDFTAEMEFQPRCYNHMAGVACYYNYDNYCYLYVSCDDEGNRYVMVLTDENKELQESDKIIIPSEGSVYLKAEVRVERLGFFYSMNGTEYLPVGKTLDMRMLSDERIEGNGFTGAMVGVSCQDLEGSGMKASFASLNYQEID